jgi:chromosome segregation ATPase
VAIENKNNESLPSDFDDESTVSLETLSVEQLSSTELQDKGQASEKTLDFERIDNLADFSEKAEIAGGTDVNSRKEHANRLRFDIQQLRLRWSGLEKEIQAREELTVRLNTRLKESQRKLAAAESTQSAKEADNDALRATLKDKLSLLTSVEREAKKVSETVESGQAVINELQRKVTEQQTTIRKLSEENVIFATKKSVALKALEDKEEQIAGLKIDVSVGNRETRSQKLDLSRLRKELGSALQEIGNIHASLHSDRAPERRENYRRMVDQDSVVIRDLQEVNTLKSQIVRTESYADELRKRLQEAAAKSGNDQKQMSHLENSLAQVTAHVRDLKEQLKNESLAVADLRKEKETIRREFDDEIRQVRFELGNAEQTLAGQESMSEQLASDLIDNQEYRQALESQLEKTSIESKKTIGKLSLKIKRLQDSNEDIERQLENKSNAIAALLNELASRSRTIDSIGEIENVIHEIDGRMSDQIDEKSSSAKDKMARLLIGNVEGRELQFPLFKDRLTIGRTAHNDIQLKAHFISRRHAVIVTENGESRIVDWGSKNGVYVNDSRIAEQTLRNGDVVAIGTAEFRYEERPKR